MCARVSKSYKKTRKAFFVEVIRGKKCRSRWFCVLLCMFSEKVNTWAPSGYRGYQINLSSVVENKYIFLQSSFLW